MTAESKTGWIVDKFPNHVFVPVAGCNVWTGTKEQYDHLDTLVATTKDTETAVCIWLHLNDPKQASQVEILESKYGFEYHGVHDDRKRHVWILRNRSPAPVTSSCITSAFVFLIDVDTKSVYLILDKHRPVLTPPGGSTNPHELVFMTGLRETKEEVGVALSAEGDQWLRLCAMVNRTRVNECGANEIMCYYFATVNKDKTQAQIKLQEDEVDWGGWVSWADVLMGNKVVTNKGDKAISQLTRVILSYVLDVYSDHHDTTTIKATRLELPDLSQMSKPAEKRDPAHVMHVYLTGKL